MNLLLDTHAFIWWALDPARLSLRARDACEDTGNRLLLSVVSIWETQIKRQLGKLRLPYTVSELVEHQVGVNRIQLLPIEPAHVYALDQLDYHHRDPFDRLLIAQANVEQFMLVMVDPAFQSYGVIVLW